MDTVILDGVTYVKASRIAKDFGYTSDYVGQLCRGRKVDARVVGRTWFVNPTSVQRHKKNKHQKVVSAAPATQVAPVVAVPTPELPVQSPVSEPERHIQVKPVLGAKAAKQLKVTIQKSKTGTQYEVDEADLLPPLKKVLERAEVSKSTPISVGLADAGTVSVKARSRDAQFAPSVLPDVALSGTLKITCAPDAPAEESGAEVDESVELQTKDIDNKNKAMSEPLSRTLKPTSTKPVGEGHGLGNTKASHNPVRHLHAVSAKRPVAMTKKVTSAPVVVRPTSATNSTPKPATPALAKQETPEIVPVKPKAAPVTASMAAVTTENYPLPAEKTPEMKKVSPEITKTTLKTPTKQSLSEKKLPEAQKVPAKRPQGNDVHAATVVVKPMKRPVSVVSTLLASPVAVFVFALLCGAAILATDIQLGATESGTSRVVSFQLANLLSALGF